MGQPTGLQQLVALIFRGWPNSEAPMDGYGSFVCTYLAWIQRNISRYSYGRPRPLKGTLLEDGSSTLKIQFSDCPKVGMNPETFSEKSNIIQPRLGLSLPQLSMTLQNRGRPFLLSNPIKGTWRLQAPWLGLNTWNSWFTPPSWPTNGWSFGTEPEAKRSRCPSCVGKKRKAPDRWFKAALS